MKKSGQQKEHASSLPSGLFVKLSFGSDKQLEKLYLTWIKFRIVAYKLSSMGIENRSRFDPMPMDGTQNMKLYVTYGSPYARLARIIVIEKALEDRVEVIQAKTRTPGSPYYQINPSGRVPYLVDDSGVGMEDSQLICAYLDRLDGKPRFHGAARASDWAYLRLEFAARSMCDGIAVWGREMARPESERSPTTLAHELTRAQRMADYFEDRVTDPLMQGRPAMAHLILAVAVEMARKRGLGDLTAGRWQLASWMGSISNLPSMQKTTPP
jgi:glutathione S-transferase